MRRGPQPSYQFFEDGTPSQSVEYHVEVVVLVRHQVGGPPVTFGNHHLFCPFLTQQLSLFFSSDDVENRDA